MVYRSDCQKGKAEQSDSATLSQDPKLSGTARAQRPGQESTEPYKHYVLQQYNLKRRQVKVLFREIQQQGYQGSYMTVSRYVRQLAQTQGIKLRQFSTRRVSPVVDSPRPPLTPKRAAFFVLRRAETLQADEVQLLQRLSQQVELALAITLAQDFAQLVRHRRAG